LSFSRREVVLQTWASSYTHGRSSRSRCGLRERDREQAVLKAAVEEDVAEARRDDAADSEAAYGPYGGLARAATGEVRAREQDRRVAIGILVERAVGVQRSVGCVAQRLKRAALAGAFGSFLQKRGQEMDEAR